MNKNGHERELVGLVMLSGFLCLVLVLVKKIWGAQMGRLKRMKLIFYFICSC